MKQHITVEQLNELSDKLQKKLRVWFTDNYSDKDIPSSECIDTSGEHRSDWPSSCKYGYEPLLSIGQLIEFLDEHNEYEHWWEEILYPEGKDIFLKYEGELCDALWEAVKKILEK